MTPAQIQILQHSLGVDEYGQGSIHRNHFCAGVSDESVCRDLVALGYMKQHPTTELFPYFNCSVTEAGKAAMLAESPKPPKLTRSQQRWRRFVKSGAQDGGYTFPEWLKYEAERARAGVGQ